MISLPLDFFYPWVILCLPLPWLVYYVMRVVNPPIKALHAPALYTLMQRYRETKKKVDIPTCTLNNMMFLSLWALLLMAAAGPYYSKTLQPTLNEKHHIIIALDLSDSMATRDIALSHGRSISRLDSARQFLQQTVNSFPQEKIGFNFIWLYALSCNTIDPQSYDNK